MDPEAWQAFYVQHRRLVRGIQAGLVGYTTDLDDLGQQVFLTAATLVKSGKVVLRGDESGLRAWVASIALRLGHAALRRRRHAIAIETPEQEQVGTGPHLDPVARQVLAHARIAWNKLPMRLRTPWLLRKLEQMTVEEIALTLALSPATIKRRLAESEGKFRRLASADPVLRDYFDTGGAL
jgi:RNA polymerase sigma factor (sigma-70 family)